jgi:quercetin dioxygenase-like cupin family protein
MSFNHVQFIRSTAMRNSTRIAIGVLVAGTSSIGLALATPGSGGVSTLLARGTTFERVNIKTHPHEPSDIVMAHATTAPGGYSGWHSHPGFVLASVTAGTITLYDADDPSCTPKYVSAGQAFTEEPGHVHFARNEGAVPEQHVATYVVPLGSPTRTDAPNPGNCPF